MKAFVRVNAADLEVRLSDMPIPRVGEDEVLIRVGAFGVGIHDRYFIPMNAAFPYVIGSEGAGVIEKCGARIDGFHAGDRVIFTTALQPQGGSWAQWAVAKGSTLIPLPQNMDFAQGAAIPIAGKSALECMREVNLTKGNRLFIAGASGAIGTILIQLAAAEGIRVAASASPRNHDYMKELGAEIAVDYRDADWTRQVREWSKGGVDAAIAIQPGTGVESLPAVKDGGLLLTVSGDSGSVAPERQVQVRQMAHDWATQKKMIDLVQKVSAGKVKIVIENEYPFDRAIEALEKTETRRARGKLIVRV